MDDHSAYIDRILGDIEELRARICALGGHFAHQKAHVGERYQIELDHIRTCFAELRLQVGEMHEDRQPAKLRSMDTACKNLMLAADHLIDALRTSCVTRIPEFTSTSPKIRLNT
jgi:hypothetical protein